MNESPPPLPAQPASVRGLIISAYVFCGLTIIPVLGFITGLISIGLGIRLLTKGQSTHGTVILAGSGILLFILVPITVIFVLTFLGDQLKEVFSQVTQELATQPTR